MLVSRSDLYHPLYLLYCFNLEDFDSLDITTYLGGGYVFFYLYKDRLVLDVKMLPYLILRPKSYGSRAWLLNLFWRES